MTVRISVISFAGMLSLLIACAPPAPATPTSPPPQATVAAAGTQVTGAVGAAATAVQTGVVQPTVVAARTEVVATVQSTGATAVTQATNVTEARQAAGTAVAPTVQAAGQAAGATVVTQATNVSQARQAAATAVAPTAQAVATRVAPTVQAVATQATGAVSTSVATSPVHVTGVKVDQNDTTVQLQNMTSTPMNLNGWTLLLGPSFAVTLGDIALGPQQTRTLHFSQGADSASDVYLGFGSNAANSTLTSGARVVLVAPSDAIASVYPIS